MDAPNKILRDVKSNFVVKGIFSFLNEKKKLNLIKHSKCLQKILFVNLEDYKRVNGQ